MRWDSAIDFIMTKNGVTKKTLAAQMGYASQSAVYNLFSRKNAIRLDIFLRLAAALGYQVILRNGEEEIPIEP